MRDYAVYVFSAERDKWISGSRWVRVARAAADGAFSITALPPGDYWVAAVDRVDTVAGAADWIDPDLLDRLLPRATRVFVGAGETRALDLRLIDQ